MDTAFIGVAALAISGMTFIATQLAERRLANKDHVGSIEDRLKACEADKIEFARQIQHAEDRITYLERKLTGG